jgi:oligoendopeptidase F
MSQTNYEVFCMVATVAQNRFIPQQLNCADFASLEPHYSALLARALDTPESLATWLEDFSALTAVVEEYGARRYIDKSCHTDDAAIEAAYLHFVEQIEPNIKPLYFQLQKKFLASPARNQLKGQRFEILTKKWSADVDIFREENVALETQITKLNNEYDKLCGARIIHFRGSDYTPQQMARFSEETDRATRREAWEASTNRRLQDCEAIEAIFDQLLALRKQIATNASFPDYRAYTWKQFKRFDYTPQQCLAFADSVAETCVPLASKMARERAAELGLATLRPWDLDVDPKGRAPLRPFQEDQVDSFVSKTREVFDRLSPALAKEFDELSAHRNLDLDSRKGKQPGGYQMSLEQSRQPFIFMNAAGLQRDVETLLHEGGHAFHFLAACRHEPLVFLRSAPMEFCEVASMSMELLGSEHFDVFYADPANAARARRKLIEGIIGILPWIAIIDSFQHWLYTHPDHAASERTTEWLRLLNRFWPDVDWSGLELARASNWQRQLHLFHCPFYYIEYGIAQLGALQLWLKAQNDPRAALNGYRASLDLGGTRTLPELFAAAGIVFDFSAKTLRPLMSAMEDELASLPA